MNKTLTDHLDYIVNGECVASQCKIRYYMNNLYRNTLSNE